MPDLKDVALDPGSPMYLPLPKDTTARYAELTVYSDTGANVCVGEFRAYGPDPAAAGLYLGADLSFTPQELAAGATFSDDGRPAPPCRSCARRARTTSGCGCGSTRHPATTTSPVTSRWPGRSAPPG